jgi:hypothetical protein
MSEFKGTTEIWKLTEGAKDPNGTRPVSASVSPSGGGAFIVPKDSFATDPLIDDDGTKVTISLKKDAAGALDGDELSLNLHLLFRKNFLAAEMKLTLSNEKDFKVRKPLLGGGFKVVVLKVTPYDPATGAIAIAGLGTLDIGGDVAIRLEGQFDPPL